MWSRVYKNIIFILLLFSLANARELHISSSIQHKITKFYADAFNISSSDVGLKVYHAPRLDEGALSNLQVTLEAQGHRIKPGYQTLKLKTWKNQQLQKTYRVTLKVIISKPVLIATKKIPYRGIINSDNTKLKKVKISSDIDDYLSESDLDSELISKQLVRKDEIVFKSLTKQMPDVKRGDQVKIHLISGNILIKTKGRVRRDCRIGDEVQVTLKKTRKRMKGELKTGNLVVINSQ